MFWFGWSDAMVPSFGVLDSNGTAKASHTCYQSLAGPWTPDPGEPTDKLQRRRTTKH